MMAGTKQGKKALGRGLDALFGDMGMSAPTAKPGNGENTGAIRYISTDEIKPNAGQPRKHFDEEAIEGLSDSIIKHGMIQPVILKKSGKGYELVAGERRWRAARKAGLKEIPSIIRELTAEENVLFAIIENMQREDLNPMEEAQAFRNVMDTYGLTQEAVSKSVGKSRPYIANTLRLLKLPKKVQERIAGGLLSSGHANAIGAVKGEAGQNQLSEQIIREGLSVREAEALALKLNGLAQTSAKKAKPREKNADVKRIEDELTTLFGTRVTLGTNGRRGVIEIHYYSKDELDGLIEELRGLKRDWPDAVC
jgi:ParB family chromosome partitioning protein